MASQAADMQECLVPLEVVEAGAETRQAIATCLKLRAGTLATEEDYGTTIGAAHLLKAIPAVCKMDVHTILDLARHADTKSTLRHIAITEEGIVVVCAFKTRIIEMALHAYCELGDSQGGSTETFTECVENALRRFDKSEIDALLSSKKEK